MTLQLEDEAGKRLAKIIEEDKIHVITEGLPNPPQDIGSWIESRSITLWGKAFKDFFGASGTFTKGQPFLNQSETEKALKRAILRYFWRELLPKGAIQRRDIPNRFNKWVDNSSSECIFTDYQKRHYNRPHLLQCPWYVELRENEKCPGDERAYKAQCEKFVEDQGDDSEHGEDDDVLGGVGDENLSEKQKKRIHDKNAKLEARLKEREDKKIAKEADKKLKRDTTAQNREIAKEIVKHGPEKVLSQLGLSPSGSSMPTSSAQLPSQTVYTIPVVDLHHGMASVEIINDSASGILKLFDDLAEGDEPPCWERIRKFISDNRRTKKRYFKGVEGDDPVVDLIIFDVPEGLPVPGLGNHGDVPVWNRLQRQVGTSGKEEAPWIQAAFAFADQFIEDNGAVLVFYPDSKFISNEILSWAEWGNFVEEAKWFAINGLPLTIPDHPIRTHKCFMVKCFVRKENIHEEIPKSNFRFHDRKELASQGIKLSSDGHITNNITAGSLTIRSDNGTPWRGAREKSENLLQALIDLCTQEDDIVMDLTASTGIFSLPHLQPLYFHTQHWMLYLLTTTTLILGASIRACQCLHRHVIALESDKPLYEEVLLPLLPPTEVQSGKVPKPSPPNAKKRFADFDDEPEKKSAPKRSCK